MDETAPAASSALESKESLFSSTFGFGFFLFNSAALRGGDLAFPEGGFQMVIGIIANGCSTAAPKRLLASTSGLEGGGSKPWEPRLKATTPAPALGQEKSETPPISELWPEPAGPSQWSLIFSFSHFGASETSPPNKPKSLPW